jgi:hypothetical protein
MIAHSRRRVNAILTLAGIKPAKEKMSEGLKNSRRSGMLADRKATHRARVAVPRRVLNA